MKKGGRFRAKKRPPRTLHFGSLGGSGFEPRCPGSAEECGVGNHFKRHRGAQRLVDGGHWSDWSLVNVIF